MSADNLIWGAKAAAVIWLVLVALTWLHGLGVL